MRLLAPILALWTIGCCEGLTFAQPMPPDDTTLKMERVELVDHPPYEGLIESEDAAWITLIQIQRPPGQPMHLVIRPIDRHHVISVVRLEPEQKAKLRQAIDQFRNHAAIEAGRMEAVSLEPRTAEGNAYRHYAGAWFTLDSTADESNTRRVVVRAEQIFAAYRQILSPRTSPDRPPRLVVFDSLDAYHAFLDRLGLKIQNRACFAEDKNLVAAGSELARLSSIMTKVNAQNDQLRRDLKDLEKRLADRLRELGDHFKKTGLSKAATNQLLVVERRKFDDQIKKAREELLRSDREIARIFNQNTRQTFVLLYHESFHAYLSNYVYPRGGFDVPYWLNEGLAVMFEGGMLEGNTLRIDSPSSTSLRQLKEDAAAEHPLPLEQLLTAGQNEFLTHGDASQAAAQRYYANAWGLAYYLTFEKRVLGSPALDRYVQPNHHGTTPVQRFEKLVEMPIEKFEPQWREYIESLKCKP
jgi:hypothetical protein